MSMSKKRKVTLRTQLLMAFTFITLFAVSVTSSVSVWVNFRYARQQAFDRLTSVADLQTLAIESWLYGLQMDLDTLLTSTYELDSVAAATSQSALLNPQYAQDYLRGNFQKMVARTQRFDEVFVLNLDGEVVVSTDRVQERKFLGHERYFAYGQEGFYVQPPYYDVTQGRLAVFVARPAFDQLDNLVGVLVGRANLTQLNDILARRDILGEFGETYLVTPRYLLLTQALHATPNTYVHSEGIDHVVSIQQSGMAVYQNYSGAMAFGVYRWLPALQVALIAEMDQAEVLRGAQATGLINIAVAVVAIALAGGGALIFARTLSQPLEELVMTTTRVAAGDYHLNVQSSRTDELGQLALAFNQMTRQLRELISSLEQRVEERTRGLETVAEVSRATTSLLNLTQLLPQVVNLVRDRFDLYYVGLFLVDEAREYALLSAGTGDAGRQMMAEGWRLAVGGDSMIGQCVANGEVGVRQTEGDGVGRLENPYLPDTRSELALPLRYGTVVIGAMTVQSVVESAFDSTYIALLQNMADQVAVAVQNARLFAEVQSTLDRLYAAQRRYQGEAWGQYIQTRPVRGYEYGPTGLTPLTESLVPEAQPVLQYQQAVVQKDRLVIPVAQGDQIVGVLGFEQPFDKPGWGNEDVALIESLSEQLLLAAENQRLIDETQRAAARERLLGQIAGRVREELDMENVLKTAVTEIQQALGLQRVLIRMVAADAALSDEEAAGAQRGRG
ncbi:MAG TPA: GAF domain-containing protein [Anaerolineae bacterium]|nr:GAF domain-containing protein [Anaerolineae bacterium]